MSSHQLALCSRIIKTGQMAPVLAWGITHEDFTHAEAKSIWTTLVGYYLQPDTQGSILSEATLRLWNPGWEPADDMPNSQLDTLCHHVRRERIATEANASVVRFSNEINSMSFEPAKTLGWFHAHVSQLIALGATKNTDVSAKQGLANVRTKLAQIKAGVNFSVMSWPWKDLHNATFGVQPDDYVVFYGRPKSMKTWVLCKLISWAFEEGKRALVYTKEMTPDNLYNRTYACILRLAYDELRGGTTSHRDDERLGELAVMMEGDPILANQITVLSGQDAPAGGDTVPWLQGKVNEYKPDVVFVDGMYLLSHHQKWKSDEERVRGISRALRRMVLDTGIPVIATMQATRRASQHAQANLDEIAYSDALSQDCTIAARVINDKASPTISIVIGGSREFKLHGFRINGTPARDFSWHSTLLESDIMKAKEEDQSEAEEKLPKKTKKKAATKTTRAEAEEREQAQEDDHFNGLATPVLMPDRLIF